MADILIKNMEMPCNCMDYCQFCGNDMICKLTGEDISSYDGQFGRMDFCPLVEIPDEHGELIDKSVLGKMLDERISYCVREANLSEKEKDMVRWVQSIICGVFSDAPTVVEASK